MARKGYGIQSNIIKFSVVLAFIILAGISGSAYLDDFEDNDLSEWEVNYFQTVSDFTLDGNYAGYSTTGQTGVNNYQARFNVSDEKVNISFFQFYYRETSSGSYGGGMRLFDKAGNEVLGLASDNSQWMRTDGNEEYEIYSGDGYERWVRVNATFNWSDGTYDTGWKDLMSGKSTVAKDIPLASTAGVQEIWYQTFTTSTGSSYGWSYGSTHEMWLDNVSYQSSQSGNPPSEPSDPSPPDGATKVSTSPSLNVNVSDPDGDQLDVGFGNYIGFEDTRPSDWSGQIQNLSSTSSTVLSGAKSAKYRLGDNSFLGVESPEQGLVDEGNLSFSIRINRSFGSSYNGVYVYFRDSRGEPVMKVRFRDWGNKYVDWYDSAWGNIATWNTKQKHTVTVSPNYTSDTADVYLDGSLKAEGSTFPEGLDAENITSVSFLIRTDSTGGIPQTIWMDDIKLGYQGKDPGVTSTASTNWDGIQDNTKYSWFATADDGSNINQSNIWSFNTGSANPESPSVTSKGPESTNLNPSDGVNLKVNVSEPTDEKMNVTFYDASDDSQIGKVENVNNGTYTATWNGLNTDQTYNWYANVTDGSNTVQSQTSTFTTIDITLNWNDNSNNENGFRIYSNASGSLQEVISTSANTQSKTVYNTGLQFNKNTTYEIAAYNQYGESNRIKGYVVP